MMKAPSTQTFEVLGEVKTIPFMDGFNGMFRVDALPRASSCSHCSPPPLPCC